MSTKTIVALANKLSKKHLLKTASADRFAEIIKDYDTGPLLVDDFVEGLKMATYASYAEGKGFSEETFQLLLKQADVIASALEAIKPELERIDEAIDSIS